MWELCIQPLYHVISLVEVALWPVPGFEPTISRLRATDVLRHSTPLPLCSILATTQILRVDECVDVVQQDQY